jgi:nickel transport protein
MKRLCLFISLFIFLPLLTAFPAHSHKMRVFAYSEGDTISGEAAFSGGRMAKGIEIIVEDSSSGKQILVTRTGEDGTFSFAVPETAKSGRLDLRIIGNGGDGHRGEWLLAATDYLMPQDENRAARPTGQELKKGSEPPSRAVSAPALCDEEAVVALVDAALTRQLAPIKRSLAEQRERRISMNDILGGLGYLIGLAGLAAYFRSKKRTGGTDDA